MALYGQGDPRWLVQERADGTNVSNDSVRVSGEPVLQPMWSRLCRKFWHLQVRFCHWLQVNNWHWVEKGRVAIEHACHCSRADQTQGDLTYIT
jgi:hypothetical protein